MQVSSNDNFHHASAFVGHSEQSQNSADSKDQEMMHASPMTMATNGTSSPSVAGSEPSGTGSTGNDIQPPPHDLVLNPIAFLLRCPECPYETLSLERMRSHFPCSLRVAPTKFFIYRCDSCKSFSTSRKLIEEHKTMHHAHPTEVTISEVVDQIDPLVPLIPDDRPSPMTGNSLVCPICRSPCRTAKDLAVHFESVHSKALLNSASKIVPSFLGNTSLLGAPPLPQLICYLCNAMFSDHESLLSHLTRSHKEMMMAVLAVNDINVSPSKVMNFNNINEYDSEMESSTAVKEPPSLTAASTLPVPVSVPISTPPTVSISPTPVKPKLNSGLFLSSPFPSPVTLPNLAGLQSLNPTAAAAIAAASMVGVNPATDMKRTSILPGTQPLPLHNTLRKTKSDMKVINRFLASKGDERDVCDMTVDELNAHLQDFIMNARKKDQNDYEPESLKAFIHSLERHLKGNDYQYSVLRDAAFSSTRAVLQNRLQNLRQASRSALATGPGMNARGVSPGVARQTYSDLLKCGLLGHDSPQALLSTLFVVAKKYFGIKGPARHKMLTWGQFSVVETPLHGEVLQFRCETLGVRQHSRSAALNFPIDVIQTFRIYENLRPVECRSFSDPFYLSVDPAWEHGGSWFRPMPLGLTYLQRIPRLLTSGFSHAHVSGDSAANGLLPTSSSSNDERESLGTSYEGSSMKVETEELQLPSAEGRE